MEEKAPLDPLEQDPGTPGASEDESWALEDPWSPWGPQTWSSYEAWEILAEDQQLFRVRRDAWRSLA